MRHAEDFAALLASLESLIGGVEGSLAERADSMKSHWVPSRGVVVAMSAPQRPSWVDAAENMAPPLSEGETMTVPSKTELRSVTELLGLLNDQLIDLLDRALEIVESAYACPEWVSWNRGAHGAH